MPASHFLPDTLPQAPQVQRTKETCEREKKETYERGKETCERSKETY
jgi:hypothetical protein